MHPDIFHKQTPPQAVSVLPPCELAVSPSPGLVAAHIQGNWTYHIQVQPTAWLRVGEKKLELV